MEDSLARPPRIVLLTATFARDIEAFRLLRKSLLAVGCTNQHYVVVDEEDRRIFEEFESDQVLISTTAQVLPPWLERSRCRRSYRRRDIRHWLNGRATSGWWCQQIIKLSASQIVNGEATVVLLDSETVFLSPIISDLFVSSDGKARLFAARPESSPSFHYAWAMKSLPLLQLHDGHSLRDFITWPQVFDTNCLTDLHTYLEKCYNRSWQASLIKSGALEYPTYGLYRCHRWSSKHGDPIVSVPDWMATFTNLKNLKDPIQAIREGIRRPGILAFVANSFNGLDTNSIETVWKEYIDELSTRIE